MPTKHDPTARSGATNSHWRGGRITTEHGYIKLNVGRDHPLADPNGYAYEHLLVWVSAGHEVPPAGWILHHANEVKADNRLSNLELLTRAAHQAEHHLPKISDAVVVKIREEVAAGATQRDVAQRHGVRSNWVSEVVRGEARKTAGGPITLRRRTAR